ncbi:MAG: MBL fold metallo-hydrolase [Thermodesulfobacteria bacterium]|nr:MBL fold metallo-hydrolase [Thermodesulfobacteriota bacterium]
MAKIQFFGAAQTVTGSCHMLKFGSRRFILDAGQFQGPWEIEKLNYKGFGFQPSRVDGMILSHGHLDHCGRIPLLQKGGFTGRIYCTPPTVDIASLILLDAAHVLKEEFVWKKRRLTRAGIKVLEPLFSAEDVYYSMELFGPAVSYGKRVEIAPGIGLTFHLNDAGHVLGSSQIVVDYFDRRGKKKKLLYTGDLGDGGRPLVSDPAPPEKDIDVLVMESTYGDRDHKSYDASVEELEEAIISTMKRRGAVLIPTFALERAQEILYHIGMMKKTGKLSKKVPVFLNSPLAINLTRIYEKHCGYCNHDNFGDFKKGDHPFNFPGLHYTETAEESKAIHNVQGPKIVLAGSGMMTGGRIKHHLKHLLWKETTTLIIVGYQAEGTLGRKIIEGAKEVKIFGEPIAVRARVYTINGFSAHADRTNLLNYVKAARPKKLFLVHGEPRAQAALASTIQKVLPRTKVHVPALKESFVI